MKKNHYYISSSMLKLNKYSYFKFSIFEIHESTVVYTFIYAGNVAGSGGRFLAKATSIGAWFRPNIAVE